MVYMADDFYSVLNWQEDFNEMEAGLQAPGTNIIALVDPWGPDNSTLYRVKHDPNFLDSTIVSEVINDNGAVITGKEVNMASASTLKSFVEFSMLSYPADHFVLILWGHGAGWRGICPDGTDLLTLPDLSSAFYDAMLTTGRMIDIIAFDSCAEAALETLMQVHDYCKLFLGSESAVPFQGLPYTTVVNDLAAQPSQSPEEFASRIVDDYILWSSANTDFSLTMGVFNLTKIWGLEASLNLLSAQGQKYDPIFHKAMRDALNGSERYEEQFSVDFGHLMWQLQRADLPLEVRYYALDCLRKSEGVVEYFRSHDNPDSVDGVRIERASGFTIYAPGNGTGDNDYGNLSIASSQWDDFGRLLRNSTITVPNGLGPTVTYSSSTSSAKESTLDPLADTAKLTSADGAILDYVWIFRNQSGGLVLQSYLAIYGPELSISYPGRLTLATSSYMEGKLYSYRTLNITLEGSVSITVQLSREDRIVSDVHDEYEITMIAPDDRWIIPEELPDSSIFTVFVPDDAMIGDMVTIEVVDRSSGDIVAIKNVFVLGQNTTVSLDIFSPCECVFDIVVPLLFALLPGLILLGFALSMHFQGKKKEGKKSQTRTSS